MSAFFVSRQTIHDTVTAIAHAAPVPRSTDALDVIGSALWAMNAEALRQRYPSIIGTDEDRNNTGDADAYCYFPPRHMNAAQMAKSVHCLAYQCSEGDVSGRDLFKMLSDLGKVLADPVGYDDAVWDRARDCAA